MGRVWGGEDKDGSGEEGEGGGGRREGGGGGWVATDLLLCGYRLQLCTSALPLGYLLSCLFLACLHLQENINHSLA